MQEIISQKINTFALNFANNRTYGLYIIRNIFFLNAGTALLIYSFTHTSAQFHLAIPAMVIAAVGKLDCLLAGYFGWKHWIKEGKGAPKATSFTTMPDSVKMAFIIMLCAGVMWVTSALLMMHYYNVI